MYKEGFVLAILDVNGRPLKDIDGAVRIPFGSEYKIRLRNRNYEQCKARVYIDGSPVSMLGDFVISGRGLLDLERFLDSSLSEGKKFKFVHRDEGTEGDPGNPENGIIRVEFFKEKPKTWKLTTSVYQPWIYTPWTLTNSGSDDSDDGTHVYWNCENRTDNLGFRGGGNQSSMYCCSAPISDGEIGKTVGGAQSNQQFSYTWDFETESTPVILEVKLLAPKDKHYVVSKPSFYCSQCGSKIQSKDRFCSHCGTKLN